MGTGSPSRPKARLKGAVRHTGMAPPSTETTVSALTRDRIFGEDDVAKQPSSPAPAGRAARPSGGLFRFWAWTLRDSADRISATPDQTSRANSGQVVDELTPAAASRLSGSEVGSRSRASEPSILAVRRPLPLTAPDGGANMKSCDAHVTSS
jgi:hypothetical protein